MVSETSLPAEECAIHWGGSDIARGEEEECSNGCKHRVSGLNTDELFATVDLEVTNSALVAFYPSSSTCQATYARATKLLGCVSHEPQTARAHRRMDARRDAT